MSQPVLAHLVHRFASQIRVGGFLCLSANGDPALVSAFKALGWADPYRIEPEILPDAPLEVAAVEAPERAVLPVAKKRVV